MARHVAQVFSCEGSHPKTTRLCVCGAVGERPPTPKKWWLTTDLDKDISDKEDEEEEPAN
jgi:hypothetical protein